MIQQFSPGFVSGENANLKRYMHPDTVALFTMAKTQKQPRCPSIDGWMKTI